MNGRSEGMSRAGGTEHTGVGRYVYFSCLVVAAQIGILLLLDRQWFCSCGSVRLWQGTMDPAQNSQQLTDPYSFLHFAFGCGLFLWLKSIRPHWHLARRATYALASSAIWEIIENLPFMIEMFGTEGSGLQYSGDSIANSIGDTLIVLLGFLVASRLSTRWTVSAILALELTTFALIGDGLIVGLLRFTASSMMV